MAPAREDAERRLVLATARTHLTTWVAADSVDLLTLHSDAATMRFVRNGRPETRSEVEELIGSYIEQQARQGWTKWRLVDMRGHLIGRAGFAGTDEVRTISFLIARPLWGRGLASEVASALIVWHLANAPSSRLQATVEYGNDASVRVLKKIGFQDTGTTDHLGVECWKLSYPTST